MCVCVFAHLCVCVCVHVCVCVCARTRMCACVHAPARVCKRLTESQQVNMFLIPVSSIWINITSSVCYFSL